MPAVHVVAMQTRVCMCAHMQVIEALGLAARQADIGKSLRGQAVKTYHTHDGFTVDFGSHRKDFLHLLQHLCDVWRLRNTSDAALSIC